MCSAEFTPTDHTTVRVKKRASYDRELAYRILDDAFVAHVGFVIDERPFVIMQDGAFVQLGTVKGPL